MDEITGLESAYCEACNHPLSNMKISSALVLAMCEEIYGLRAQIAEYQARPEWLPRGHAISGGGVMDHNRIYLQPECCAEPDMGRMWCENPDPTDCDEGNQWTAYVRADHADALAEALRKIRNTTDCVHSRYVAKEALAAYEGAKQSPSSDSPANTAESDQE